MPRQSRSRPAPRKTAPAPSQSRGAHSAAAPPTAWSPPVGAQAQAKQPGMFAQMAATAGSVAVGSTIGHGISNMLFGGRSAEQSPETLVPQAQAPPLQQHAQGMSCDAPAKDFTECLKTSDVQGCAWYLEQLKAAFCYSSVKPLLPHINVPADGANGLTRIQYL
ncbi:hypothetical protein BD410DRAFT_828194 [Rickenella mellea]|uniref:CHCH domain-containing protein n=1 Tax=Rickenella mellea TaxID=50990 RepID=A0A4Y7Q627_9AGAM|nr:hypothetical protein BD410DRAFT_828194 [Rickenella mellea]